MTESQADPTEVIERLTGAVMRCEPCLLASIFGGDHHCTGEAPFKKGHPCPCCGTATADAV